MAASHDSNMQQCPLCAGANCCLMANSGASDNKGCWCANEEFPEAVVDQLAEFVDQLAELPAPARCICKACLQAARKEVTHAG